MFTIAALKNLFDPITLGGMEVKNRLVMPPMSVNFGVDEEGCVTKRVAIRGFLPDGVVFDRDGEQVTLKDMTDLVIAEGSRSIRDVSEIFARRNIEVHVIGDARSPRTLLDCLSEADELGRAL